MRSRSFLAGLFFAVTAVTLAADQRDFMGRWTLMGTGANPGSYWLEVKDEGGKLVVMFLNRGGSPMRIENGRVDKDELVFTFGQQNQPQTEFRGKVSGGKITASLTRDGRTTSLAGGRPPSWPAANANGSHTYGAPVLLFDGTSLDAFTVQFKDRPINWSVENGLMTNAPKGNNLVSKEKFKDFKITAEYKVGPGTNSGIYLRGRYELQVLDDFGKPAESHGHMSIYAWKAPAVNASKPAGEWQTMEAVIVGNRVTVTHNGQRVHDNAVIEAITGGALDTDEAAPGPVMIQGDHTGVSFRKITVTPITRAGK